MLKNKLIKLILFIAVTIGFKTKHGNVGAKDTISHYLMETYVLCLLKLCIYIYLYEYKIYIINIISVSVPKISLYTTEQCCSLFDCFVVVFFISIKILKINNKKKKKYMI